MGLSELMRMIIIFVTFCLNKKKRRGMLVKAVRSSDRVSKVKEHTGSDSREAQLAWTPPLEPFIQGWPTFVSQILLGLLGGW